MNRMGDRYRACRGIYVLQVHEELRRTQKQELSYKSSFICWADYRKEYNHCTKRKIARNTLFHPTLRWSEKPIANKGIFRTGAKPSLFISLYLLLWHRGPMKMCHMNLQGNFMPNPYIRHREGTPKSTWNATDTWGAQRSNWAPSKHLQSRRRIMFKSNVAVRKNLEKKVPSFFGRATNGALHKVTRQRFQAAVAPPHVVGLPWFFQH